jgi:uncharacterized integral membrane protein (TIGR00698 family)
LSFPIAYRFSRKTLHRYFPGVVVCFTVAAAARFLSDHYGAPQMLFALLLGLAFHFLAEENSCIPGIELTAKKILQIGVALLGMRITVDQVIGLGLDSVALVGAGVIATILVGIGMARLLGRTAVFGMLTGGAVGICGASAALAISAVLPRNSNAERNTIFTVIAVTTLSTISMIAYPIIATWLGMSDHTAGLFLGGSIHDVAQVIGAGYGLSPEVGDISTVTKLFRVAMLVPVVFTLSLLFRNRGGKAGKIPVPFFVLFFCLFVGINSYAPLPEGLHEALVNASRWCLVAAIGALGVKTSLKSLAQVGTIPIVMMVSQTAFLALWIIGGTWILGMG